MAKTWSSAASCSTSKRPAFTPAIRPACCLRSIFPQQLLKTIRDYTFRLARALKVIGLMNVQYAIQRDKVFVIEVNPRASRTVPYVSKATGVPLAKIAARLMTGRKLREFLPENIERATDLDTGNFYFVKSPVFPWGKFPGVDTVLGPEMKSTGEVMGVADNFGEAFAKAQTRRRTECCRPQERSSSAPTIATSPSSPRWRNASSNWASAWSPRTARRSILEDAGLHVERVYKVKEGRPNVVDLIKGERIQLIINTPHGVEPWFDEKAIRRAAVTARIPTITTLSAARAACEGIAALQRGEAKVYALQQLHAERVAATK